MKYAVKHFVDSRDQKNGLFLIDMPTGSGKTFGATDILSDYIKGVAFCDVPKIIYITPLIKNIDDVIENLKNRFDEKEKYLVDNKIVKLSANYENVVNNFNACIDKIPPVIKKTKSYKELKEQIDLYWELKEYKDKTFATENILDQIRKVYEPAFRKEIKDIIFVNDKTKKERKTTILTKYIWMKELYPSIIAEDRSVIFMTVNKFVSMNDPIISKPYRFSSSDIIKDSLIIIDEFDAAKNVILNQMIDDCCDYKLDVFKLFSGISLALDGREFEKTIFANSYGSEEENSSFVSFNKMKKVILDTKEEYKLMYSFKLENPDEEKCFLFDDFSLHTIPSTNKTKAINVKYSKDNNQNMIKIQDIQDGNFREIISHIKGAVSYFITCCSMMARNYMNYYNENAKDSGKENIEINEAVSTILNPFNLDSNIEKTISSIIINDYSRPKKERQNKLIDVDFYQNGFRYYDFKDDKSHDTSTTISMCYLDNTPENFLVSICDKAMVIGLSATGTIDNVTGNFDHAYLKRKLGTSYYHIEKEDEERIKKSVYERIGILEKLDYITTEKISVVGDDNKEIASHIFGKKDYIDFYASQLEQYQSDQKDFDIKRVTKVLLAIKKFILNVGYKSILIMTNKNLRDSNDLYSKDTMVDVIQNICKENDIENNIDVYQLFGNKFTDEKAKYQQSISSGRRVVLFSSYPSAGTGQNLQYIYNDGEFERQEDISSIYIEYPTHTLVNLDEQTDEKDIIKYIFQMESLRMCGDLDSQTALSNIKSAFKTLMNGTKSFAGKEYQTDSVNNTNVKILIQAVGRICRTVKEEKKQVSIYVDETIFDKCKFDFLIKEKKLLNPEFYSIVKMAPPKEDNARFKHIREAINKNEIAGKIINNILTETIAYWTKKYIYEWETIRNVVLKYPTISAEILEKVIQETGLDNIKDLYFHTSNNVKINKYYFGNTITQKLDEKNSFEISCEASRLPDFLKNEEIRKHFKENGYATEFKKEEYIILPCVFQNIYKGAIGEIVGKFIIESWGIPLTPLRDADKYEKFDYEVQNIPGVYIDFKNWSIRRKKDFNTSKKTSEKIEKIGAERALIINIESDEHSIHNYGNILVVPNILSISKEEKQNIISFILRG